MTLYHIRWTWARRWWHWRFVLRYQLGTRFWLPLGLAVLALGLWAAWPELSAWVLGFRQTYCILYLMWYGDLAGVWGC